jgi:hypothetical protein
MVPTMIPVTAVVARVALAVAEVEAHADPGAAPTQGVTSATDWRKKSANTPAG